MFLNRQQINRPSDVFDKRRQQMTPLLHRCEKHIAEIVRRKGHMIKFMTSSIYFFSRGVFPMQLLKRFNFLIIKLCPVHYTWTCKTKVNYWYAQMLQMSARSSHSVTMCFKSFENNMKVFVRKFQATLEILNTFFWCSMVGREGGVMCPHHK